MAKGLTLPFQTNTRGGLQITEGPDLLKQNILLGLKPSSNQHPWNQRLAPREDLIYDIADSAVGGEFSAHVYDLFDDLRKLQMATISRGPNAIRVSLANSARGDVDVTITYVDLEDNKSREIQFNGVK